MSFNHVSIVQSCFDFINNDAPMTLVYYSHFTSIIVSLILGFVVIGHNRKSITARLLFSLSIVFSLWVLIDLITWTSYDSTVYMFVWSFFGILTSLIYLISIIFSYSYIYSKDISNKILTTLFLLILPVVLFTPTVINLGGFSDVDCVSIESPLFTNYFHLLGVVAFVMILIIAIKGYIKTAEKSFKKQIVLMTIGIEAFIIVFFTTTFLDSYLVDAGVTGDYLLGNYGLFGIIIFMTFLAYLIVKFKAFDIKLVGAQALVWAIGILIGSQFFYIQNNTNRILTAITLLLTIFAGIMLVKSVKKEVEQKEQLEIANQNQSALIRFITHQVKGFFTKSKAIFAGLRDGDYGEVNAGIKEVVEEGLNSDNQAVNMIQDILKAASLKTGKMELHFEKTDLVLVIKETVGLLEEMAKEKGLELKVNLPAEVVCVNIDKLQFSQVIKNLIDNSIRYTEKGGVTVSLDTLNPRIKKLSPKAIITVKDTGIGLSESDRKRLFTEGGHGEDSIKMNINSTGYGLYIVKKIVDAHHGIITAHSAGRNHGSTFVVELDLVK